VELARIRSDLDTIDRSLIHMLARRLEVGLEAANIKRLLDIPVHDPEREAKAVEQAGEWAHAAGLSEPEVEEIMRRVITLTRNAQIAANPE
jgi:chorismate mutase/prephenate dehydrogenase